MTTLKDPLLEGGEGSPEFGVQYGPPAATAVASDRPPAPRDDSIDLAPGLPPVAAPVLPVVLPAYGGACSSLDLVPVVRAEVVYERALAPEPAPIPAAVAMPMPHLPTVMPAYADSAGSLDFVRVVRADVTYAPAHEPAPAFAAPPQPILEAPIVEPPLPIDLPSSLAPAPAATAPPAITAAAMATTAVPTLDAIPAPPLPFPTPPPRTAPAPVAKSVRPSWRRWAKRAALAVVGLMAGYTVLVMALIVAYREAYPPLSTLMLELKLRGEDIDYRPVPLTSISSYLQRAVVTSEDARFCRHHGVDWGALAEAIQDSRGGSTITMQTAKNLFLWPSRSYIRKAIEIPIALTIDFAWPKRRILEIYLNIAEWGPGIFGAEAAAQYHFNKSAARLTPQEATLLAAVLPNPIARDAGDPGRVTELLASRLRGRMANSDAYVSCLGLRSMPRAEPSRSSPRPSQPSASKSPSRPAPNAGPWQTKTTRTEPPKPAAPAFNPWQN